MRWVFLQQLHDHLLSLRFLVSLAAVVLLFAANGLVYTWKYQRLQDLTPSVEADVDGRYGRVRDVNQATAEHFRLMSRRLPTEFMADGGASWFGDAFSVCAETGSNMSYSLGPRSSNHWVRRYEGTDWILIVRLVVSFLCIALAYDAIGGERERGTLPLALANPLSRGRFLTGKFLAHLSVVGVVCLVGTLMSLLVLSAHGLLTVDLGLLGDWGLFMAGVVCFAALMLGVAIGVSALARQSATALVALVLVWALFYVVIPQTSYLLAARAVAVDPDWMDRMGKQVSQAQADLRSEGLAPRPRPAAAADGFAVEQRYARRLQAAEQEGERQLKAEFGRAVRQYEVARRVNLLSPGFAFQYAVEALLGTGVPKYRRFERQAWEYRESLRDFLRARDAADPASPHLLFLAGYLSAVPLDGGQLPRFQEELLPWTGSAAEGVVPILVLVLEAAGGFLFALWAFGRADLGG